MATFTANFSSGWAQLILTTSQGVQSIENNTTPLVCTLSIKKLKTCSSYNNGGASVSAVVNGVSIYSSSTIDIRSLGVGSTKQLGKKTITVKHNDDGTKTVAYSASCKSGVGLGSASMSGSVALTTIPRASDFTFSSSTWKQGSSITINIDRKANTFVHTVKARLEQNSEDDNIFEVGYDELGGAEIEHVIQSGNNDEWVKEALTKSDTAKQINIIVDVTTYTTDGVKIGATKSHTIPFVFTPTVVETLGESLTISPFNFNNAPCKSILLQYHNYISAVGCSFNISNYDKLSSVDYYENGVLKKTSLSHNYPTISDNTAYSCTLTLSNPENISSTTMEYKIKITTTRGIVYEKIINRDLPKIVPYSEPKVNIISLERSPNDQTTAECTVVAKYSPVSTNASSTLGNDNLLYVNLEYKRKTTPEIPWGSSEVVKKAIVDGEKGSNGEISVPKYKLVNLSASDTYVARLTFYDSLGVIYTTQQYTLKVTPRIINIRREGDGIAFGGMAEEKNTFICNWDAVLGGSTTSASGVNVASDRRLKHDIETLNIDLIESLVPVQYKLNEIDDGKTHYGFIAQDVSDALAVNGIDPSSAGIVGMNNDRYSLVYTEFIPLLTKKCQDLQGEIEYLKAEIKELKDNK